MRGAPRAGLIWSAAEYRRTPDLALVVLLLFLVCACDRAEPPPGPSPAVARAERRLYDGAPPVIPHARIGPPCISCHNQHGMEVAGLGYAPPSPHEVTAGLSAISRCEQCHVFRTTSAVFDDNGFVGLRQDLRRGGRLYDGAPPVMPHPAFMHENCRACHTGPAARAEVVCDHPERVRCPQCHVQQTTAGAFERR